MGQPRGIARYELSVTCVPARNAFGEVFRESDLVFPRVRPCGFCGLFASVDNRAVAGAPGAPSEVAMREL